MRKLVMRTASDEDAERISELVDPDKEFFPNIKWVNVFPYWQVVTFEDEPEDIVACVQVITSTPIGSIEFLSLDEKLSPMQKAYAIKVIKSGAELMLYSAGIYVAISRVPFEMKQWKKILKKQWGEQMYEANVFAMRVR